MKTTDRNKKNKINQKKVKEFLLKLSDEEVNRRIDQLEKVDMDTELREYFISTLKVLCEVDNMLGLKNATIARLRRFFNKESEKRENDNGGRDNGAANNPEGNGDDTMMIQATELL
ncbi:MAG: hypothetical protein HQK53_20370, partial [Oligoflexia bacterium]|nr:hypothetical protein [Oligoflexia bacterium]